MIQYFERGRQINSLEPFIEEDEVIDLYRKNKWSSADKPHTLMKALLNSDYLVIARKADASNQLVGLANAISDGHLVVYFPHMLVLPDFHRQGIGREIIKRMKVKYRSFHQQMLTADKDSISFYQSLGFSCAGETQPMWIYDGTEH